MSTPLYYDTKFLFTGTPTPTQPPSNDIGNSLVPVGTILMYSGTTLPANYLWCNGDSYSTTTYSDLFNVIQTTYGGSGGNFNVPNLSKSFPIGASTPANMEINYQGSNVKNGGNTIIQSGQLPNHTHDPPTNCDNYWARPTTGGTELAGASTSTRVTTVSATGGVTGGFGSEYLPPFTVINYIIKYK